MAGVPPGLAELAGHVAAAIAVPRATDVSLDAAVSGRGSGPASGDCGGLRHVSPRKSVQIRLLLEALGGPARGGLRGRVDRIVDLGAGAGHLTRRANLEWKVPALGLEREGRLVERARLLSEEEGEDGQARFARFDAFSGRPRLGPADLALGLHACGALADILVAAAAEAGCPVAVVACCHQKHPGDRRDPCPFGRAA